MLTSTAAPPSGRAVLTALAALVERHPDLDCDPGEVIELLDDVSAIVRRGRAQVRAHVRRTEDAQAEREQSQEKPPAPMVPQQRPPDDPARPQPAVVPGRHEVESRPATPHRRAERSTSWWRPLAARAVPWLPILLLALAVVGAVALGTHWSGASGVVIAAWPALAPRRAIRTTSGHPT